MNVKPIATSTWDTGRLAGAGASAGWLLSKMQCLGSSEAKGLVMRGLVFRSSSPQERLCTADVNDNLEVDRRLKVCTR